MKIHALTQPFSYSAPRAASGGPTDSLDLGRGAESLNTVEAARKLFHVDTERAQHVVNTFKIDDIRNVGDIYFPPAEPVFTPRGTLVVGTNKGVVLAFDPNQGKELWRFDTGTTSAFNNPTPAPDGRLLLSNQQTPELLCLKPDGTEAFRFPLPGPATREVQVDDAGNAFVHVEGEVIAVSPTGEKLWSRPLPEEEAIVYSAPGNRTMFLTRQHMETLDAQGQPTFTHTFQSRLTHAPAFTPDGSAFVGTEKGVEVVRPDGSCKLVEGFPGEVFDVQADPFGNVLVATDNGHIWSLDGEGNVQHKRDIWKGPWGGLNVRPDGTVMVATDKKQVYHLGRDLDFIGGFYLPMGEHAYGIQTPLCAPDGSVYMRQSNQRLQVYNPKGQLTWELEGFQTVSRGFSVDGTLAVGDWSEVHVLKERSLAEVLKTPDPEPEPKSTRVERRGDWLVVGGRMVKVRKPGW